MKRISTPLDPTFGEEFYNHLKGKDPKPITVPYFIWRLVQRSAWRHRQRQITQWASRKALVARLPKGFPSQMQEDLSAVCAILPDTAPNFSQGAFTQTVTYYQQGRAVQFPYRIYLEEPEPSRIACLTPDQQMMLHCIYSRSHNGFIRQKHMEQLVNQAYPDWAIPYIVKPCDEYVLPILEVVYQAAKGQDNRQLQAFCKENAAKTCYSYARMASYWSEYHRYDAYRFRKYVGRKLFREVFGYTRAMEHQRERSL